MNKQQHEINNNNKLIQLRQFTQLIKQHNRKTQ